MDRVDGTDKSHLNLTKEDIREVLLDVLKDCELTFDDIQYAGNPQPDVTNFSFNAKSMKGWLAENNKNYKWAKLIANLKSYTKRKGWANKYYQLFTVCCPEYPWKEYLFREATFRDRATRRNFMEELIQFNGITSHEQFYDTSTVNFTDKFAREHMRKSWNRNKPICFANLIQRPQQKKGEKVAKELIPWWPWYNMVIEHYDTIRKENGEEPIEWEMYRFFGVPMTDQENLRECRIWWKNFKEDLDITTAEDIYSLGHIQIKNHNKGGQRFIERYMKRGMNRGSASNLKLCQGGLVAFLEEMETEIEFDWFKVHNAQKTRFWEMDERCREYLLRLLNHMDLDGPEDLVLVTWEDIINYYGETFCHLNGTKGVAQRIVELFPEYHLEVRDFIYLTKSEKYGVRMLQNWFGYHNVKEQFKLPIRWPSGNHMRLDAIVESLNILIEFNGISHYKIGFYERKLKHRENGLEQAARRFARAQECDIEKRLAGEGLGYRYLIIPLCKHDPNLPKWNKTFDEKTKKSQGVSFIKLCELQGITREEIEGALYG